MEKLFLVSDTIVLPEFLGGFQAVSLAWDPRHIVTKTDTPSVKLTAKAPENGWLVQMKIPIG